LGGKRRGVGGRPGAVTNISKNRVKKKRKNLKEKDGRKQHRAEKSKPPMYVDERQERRERVGGRRQGNKKHRRGTHGGGVTRREGQRKGIVILSERSGKVMSG